MHLIKWVPLVKHSAIRKPLSDVLVTENIHVFTRFFSGMSKRVLLLKVMNKMCGHHTSDCQSCPKTAVGKFTCLSSVHVVETQIQVSQTIHLGAQIDPGHQEMFWEVKMGSMALTTSPTEYQLVCASCILHFVCINCTDLNCMAWKRILFSTISYCDVYLKVSHTHLWHCHCITSPFVVVFFLNLHISSKLFYSQPF